MTGVLDLSMLADVAVLDRRRQLVRIGGGVTRGQVAAALALRTSATEQEVAAVYPTETRRRLAAVKSEYDPGNLFAGNFNIPPA